MKLGELEDLVYADGDIDIRRSLMKPPSSNHRSKTIALTIRLTKFLGFGSLGALLMLFAVGIYILNKKPDLSPWHTAALDEEYHADSPIKEFSEYLALEERLFRQLELEVYDQVAEPDVHSINRYHRGSRSDPGRWPRNWNRSYELPTGGAPKAGVLLLHGLTDSPYSLRHVGTTLHAAGAHVLSLRIPGHGTAPTALARTSWQDMAGAVALAMKHLSTQVGSAPLFIVGYSNGGALALHYTLSTLENPDHPPIEGLALISPEIGVGKVAAVAIWQERVGRILRLEKLSWNSTNIEYDPFKYVSFPVNGGIIAHELTKENRQRISSLAAQDRLKDFPRVLAFQSVVDATVSAPALVKDLFTHLPSNRHKLVAFDLNRQDNIESVLKRDPIEDIGLILDDEDRQFVFSVVTNLGEPTSPTVKRRVWQPDSENFQETPLSLSWPRDVYSLAHVSLPMPESDPLYGSSSDNKSPGIQIGSAILRGERGVLHISAIDLLRLRWNPFYSFMEEEILQHFELLPSRE